MYFVFQCQANCLHAVRGNLGAIRSPVAWYGDPVAGAFIHQPFIAIGVVIANLLSEQVFEFIPDVFHLFRGLAFQQIGIEFQFFELLAKDLHDIG